MSEPRKPRGGQRKQRQIAAPRLKTQLEIGKEYKETPWGRKSIYAASSPYCEEVLRKYAAKYTEVLREGTLRGIPVTADLLRNKSRQMKPETRVKFPDHENTLHDIFQDLRKVGIKVDGKYLKAKMIKLVREDTSISEREKNNFKASDAWLRGFKQRKGIVVRVQTNKKSRSAVQRSRMVRNFHWYIMYKAPLERSERDRSS